MTSPALKLFHASPSRSSIVLWMLEELGEPFDLKVMSLKDGDQLKPEYLAVNPMGKVPTLVDEGVAITEVAAICCHLADKYPKAGLAPTVTDPLRGPYLHWLFWAPSCLEPAIIDHVLKRPQAPRGMQGWIDYDTTIDILTNGVAKGPWILGEKFSAADVVVGAGVNWGLMFGTIPRRPELEAYADRLRARPAMQRSMAKDAEIGKAS